MVVDTPLLMLDESWKRKSFARKQMDELFEIIPLAHDEKEIEKRIELPNIPDVRVFSFLLTTVNFIILIEEEIPVVQ